MAVLQRGASGGACPPCYLPLHPGAHLPRGVLFTYECLAGAAVAPPRLVALHKHPCCSQATVLFLLVATLGLTSALLSLLSSSWGSTAWGGLRPRLCVLPSVSWRPRSAPPPLSLCLVRVLFLLFSGACVLPGSRSVACACPPSLCGIATRAPVSLSEGKRDSPTNPHALPAPNVTQSHPCLASHCKLRLRSQSQQS